jgi:hypothetical protein
VPLIYFRAIWSILLPFGTFYGYLVYLFPALVCCTKKNLASQQDFAANNQIKSITAVSPEGPILQFCLTDFVCPQHSTRAYLNELL